MIRNKEEQQLCLEGTLTTVDIGRLVFQAELMKLLLRMLLVCAHLEGDEVRRVHKFGDN